MSYQFGFSWKGLFVFVLPMIPNLFYFLVPSESTGNQVKSHIVLDVLEHGSQALFIFLLIFIIKKQASEWICSYSIGMALMLSLYFVFWILYFTGEVNLMILLGMAIVPVIYFILAEIWLHNYIAVVPTVLFGIFHVIITYLDFQSIQ